MKSRTWRFRRGEQVLWLVPSGAAEPPPRSERLPPAVAQSFVAQWLREGGSERGWLGEIAATLDGSGLRGYVTSRADSTIHDALGTGLLRAYRSRESYGLAFPRADEVEQKPASGKKAVKTTWIALHVVDDRDPKRPAAFLPYRVELPDGSMREGTLDKEGKARLESVPEGTCMVSFPTVDAKDWKPL